MKKSCKISPFYSNIYIVDVDDFITNATIDFPNAFIDKSDIGIILFLTTGGTASGNGVSVFHLDLSLDGRTLIFIELFHRGKNCDMIDKIMTKKNCDYVTSSNCNASKVSSLENGLIFGAKMSTF